MSRRTSTPSDDGDPPTDRKGARKKGLSQTVNALDVPEKCDCDWCQLELSEEDDPGVPEYRLLAAVLTQQDGHCACPHVLSADHGLTVAQWAKLLSAYSGEYAEPPAPMPGRALTREARIVLMTRRRLAGVGLFHRQDQHADDATQVGVVMGKGRRELRIGLEVENRTKGQQ